MFFNIDLNQDKSEISNYISTTLLENIDSQLKAKQKVLLYLNKRGSFSSLICEDCHYLFECPNCDISLSVHSNPEHLKCHICHHNFNIPVSCPHCHGNRLKSIWVGTQQIESLMRQRFSDATIYRFDSDALKTLSSKKQAVADLEKADIIIGTKMLTTGFDFEKVWLIAVLLVEWELGYASFDAHEKAYSNLKQLIGRGNRKSQKTDIILQSFIPKNPFVKLLTEGNFKDFFGNTLEERKDFSYPPYGEMVTLEYRHSESKKALEFLKKLETTLASQKDSENYQILRGTSTFRKNNSHHATMIIKWENIKTFIENIRSIILRESKLSLIFHK